MQSVNNDAEWKQALVQELDIMRAKVNRPRPVGFDIETWEWLMGSYRTQIILLQEMIRRAE